MHTPSSAKHYFKPTDTPFRPHISTSHNLHAQIILHFADDLYGVVELEVRVLSPHVSHASCLGSDIEAAYAIEMDLNVSACIDGGLLAAELADFA